jgi:hypothetical protein
MTSNELDVIEQRLCLVLPERYRRALLKGLPIRGGDPEPYFIHDFKELLIQNLELRMCSSSDAFAGGRWPNYYVCIGHDGCGNYYCINSNDLTCAVLFFDHEADAFEVVSENLDAYADYITDLNESVAAYIVYNSHVEDRTAIPSMSPDVVLTRANSPRESILEPITLEEWTSFVRNDSDLEMRGYRLMTNPFTKLETRLDSPGLAVLVGEGNSQEFIFMFGRVVVRRPGIAALAKLEHAAVALNANVLKDW